MDLLLERDVRLPVITLLLGVEILVHLVLASTQETL